MLDSMTAALHPDDIAEWMLALCVTAWPGKPLNPKNWPPVRRYRFLRDLWEHMLHGEAERAAFLRFLEAEAPLRARIAETWDLLRRCNAEQRTTTTLPCLRALGLTWPCTAAEVTRAYRTLAKVAHPDTGGTTGDFQALQEAYEEALAFVTRTT
jgi:hypothetical protein